MKLTAEQQRGGRPARRPGPGQRRRGHGQDVGPRGALRAGRAHRRRRGGRRARHHLHREGGRPAHHPGAAALRGAGSPRRGPPGRVRVDLDHPRLLLAGAAHARPVGRRRPGVPCARRGRGRARGPRRVRPRAGRLPRRRRRGGAPAPDRRPYPRPAGRHDAHRLLAPAQPGPHRAGAAGGREASDRSGARGPGRRARRGGARDRRGRGPERGHRARQARALCGAPRRPPPGRDRGAGRLRQALLRRQRQRAEGSGVRRVPRRARGVARPLRAPPRVLRPHPAARPDGALRAPLRRGQAQPLGARLRRSRAACS